MAYFKKNLVKGAGSPGAANQPNEVLILELVSGVIFPPLDQTNGVELQGNFVLPADEKFYKFYHTKSKSVVGYETEGEEDKQSFMHKATFEHPGSTVDVKAFVQYWTGKDVIVLYKGCNESAYEIAGTPCAPMQLKASNTRDNEGNVTTFTFEQFAKSSRVPLTYSGTVEYAAPTLIEDVTSAEFTVENGTVYEIPESNQTSEVLVYASDMPHGTVITLKGKGGTAPHTIESNLANKIILKDGVTYTALDQSFIQFRVFQSGPNERYLLEIARG
jgi:hypothetical protein